MSKPCVAAFLGRRPYGEALSLQMALCSRKKEGLEVDVLLLLEHPPVITMGRNGRWRNLLVSEEVLQRKGIERVETDRGGDITFHGPGQLVGYPILQLGPGERDVHRFMRNMEECLIRTVAAYGIEADRRPSMTGVWTERGKIGALGVHISRWITRHGFALNVSTDLGYFDLIVPCGIVGRGVTSIEQLTGRAPALDAVAGVYAGCFGEVMERDVRHVAPEEVFRLSGTTWEQASEIESVGVPPAGSR